MSLADYAVTEAGFGADLGAEKFLDTKCRAAGIEPDCVVIVATVKALKLHGGAAKERLSEEDLDALGKGMPNLLKHIENIKNVYKKPVVVAMNRFATDTGAETDYVISAVEGSGAKAVFTDVFLKGGEGGKELAEEVAKACDIPSRLEFAYELDAPWRKKSRPSPKGFTARTAWIFRTRRRKRLPQSRKKGAAACPSSSQKRNTRCRTTPSFWGVRRASG